MDSASVRERERKRKKKKKKIHTGCVCEGEDIGMLPCGLRGWKPLLQVQPLAKKESLLGATWWMLLLKSGPRSTATTDLAGSNDTTIPLYTFPWKLDILISNTSFEKQTRSPTSIGILL